MLYRATYAIPTLLVPWTSAHQNEIGGSEMVALLVSAQSADHFQDRIETRASITG